MPVPVMELLTLFASLAPYLSGGNDTEQVSGFEPSDVFSRNRTRLPGMGAPETELAGLQQSLAGKSFRAGMEALPSGLGLEALTGGNVGGVDFGGLARGELGAAQTGRIHEMAFGGIQEGIDRALAAASDRALAQGVPLSSMQYANQNELIRPLISEAGRMQAGLQMQELDSLAGLRSSELGRLGDLRQRSLGNMLALQESPALNRLLSMRMAEAEQENLNMSRFPGGLPDYAYGTAGSEQSDRAKKIRESIERITKERDRLLAGGSGIERQMAERYQAEIDRLTQEYQAYWR